MELFLSDNEYLVLRMALKEHSENAYYKRTSEDYKRVYKSLKDKTIRLEHDKD